MQAVSNDYREQSNRTLRNPTHVRVSFGIVDPQAVGTSTIEDNGAMAYSNSNLIDLAQYKVASRYGRLYENGFLLDGNIYCVPDDELSYSYQGYVSDGISDSSSEFEINPTLDIEFDEYISFSGLTIYFDSYTNNYATEAIITAYMDGDIVGIETVINDENVMLCQSNSASYVDRVVVEFTKTRFPHRDINIEHLVFGIVKVFTDDELDSVSFIRDIDLVNSKLPTESFSFTIIDKNKEFNPEDPKGLWKYLEEEQVVVAEMGYELDDLSTEWIPLCEYYTTGVSSISASVISKVTFETTSLLGYLTDDYIGGKYRSDGINLYDLAVEIMSSLELPLNADGTNKWRFDEVQMSRYSTNYPMPIMPVRDCLQLIASACCCILYTDRQGNLVIKPHNYDFIESPQFNLGYNNVYSPPSIVKYPLLRNVNVTYYAISLNSEESDLKTENIDCEEVTEFTIKYSMSANQRLELDNVQVYGTPVFYAEACIVSLIGTGKVTVKGYEVEKEYFTYSKSYNSVGDDCPVDISLINNVSHAEDYAEYIYDYVKLRTEYTVEDRGYMELDVADTIFADTGYGTYNGVLVAKSELIYNGAIKGKTKYYQCVDYSRYVDNSIVTATNESVYSNAKNILYTDVVIDANYARLYENGLILDGGSLCVPSGEYKAQGYVSEVISDSNGDFEQPPMITIDFTRYIISQNGLTFTFADEDNYPSEIVLKAYVDEELIETVTLDVDSSAYYYDDVFPSVSSANKIEIIFKETNFPYRDVRLNNLFFGKRV